MTACAKLLLAERLKALATESAAVASLMRAAKPPYWYDRAGTLDSQAFVIEDWSRQIEREALLALPADKRQPQTPHHPV